MAVEEVAKVISNWREGDLDDQEKAMLAFTEKFTLTPSQITDADIESLLQAGFSEEHILSIALGAGYRNWVDRIADLLGVEEEKFDFPEEILKAFGVTREQLQNSLYEDNRWSRLRMVAGARIEDLLSAAPGALEAGSAMRLLLMEHLTPRLFSLIGVVVAGCLCCEQFVEALRGPLEETFAVHAARDWRALGITAAEKAVLEYAEKGTLDEASARRRDVDALRVLATGKFC